MKQTTTASKPASIILLFIVAILLCSTKISYAKETDTRYIKIGLLYGSKAVSSVTVTSNSGFMIAKMTEDGIEELLPLSGYGRLIVSMEASGFVVRDTDGTLISADIGSNNCIMPMNYENGRVLKCDDKSYRGGICFYSNKNDTMNVINYLHPEEYLYGVLSAEMGAFSPLEALKAQAVTARSFTVCSIGMHKSEGFDLCSATHCQVYAGYSAEYPQTNRAVDETAGETLTYNGSVVAGYYFKNSGGHTQSISEAWGCGKEPYLVGVKDEYSPDYTWSVSMTFSDIKAKLEAEGYVIGSLQSVSIAEKNTAGAVSSIQFQGTAGTVELNNEKLRSVFGYNIIKSMMFSLGNADQDEGSETFFSKVGVLNGKTVDVFQKDKIIYVIDSNGYAKKLSLKDAFIISRGQASQIGSAFQKEAAPESDNPEKATSDPVVFNGIGYGHGIGMPQDSAIAMAKQGLFYDEILRYFYTGIKIETIY